ncbi:hypothetical protein LCGC14_2570100, partial [marine sediment metagenome]
MNLCTKGIKTLSGGETTIVTPTDGAERERRGIETLPGSLFEAIEAAEQGAVPI